MIMKNVDSVKKELSSLAAFNGSEIKVKDIADLRNNFVDKIIEGFVFSPDNEVKSLCRDILLATAHQIGIIPSSIQKLYNAMGRGETPSFTVPAVNIRGLSYDCARALFRSALKSDCGAFIVEIARSEIAYTSQSPLEYALVTIAGAIKEGFSGPIFIQGDHFQVSEKAYRKDPGSEIERLKNLISEAISAGFYNIDIDSSTIVNLSHKDLRKQQAGNAKICAILTNFIREKQPSGLTISIGGEIGEVGGHNSTLMEFEAFMEEYLPKIEGKTGISKISVQTGTSHGGIPMPDGSIASVKLDLGVLKTIGETAKKKYGLSGTVQHGASTLPEEAFHRFHEVNCSEIHLATGFQNIIYEHPSLPDGFRKEVYSFITGNYGSERKETETDVQFIYKTRKKGFGGQMKAKWWGLSEKVRYDIGESLEERFTFLMKQLNVTGTRALVERHCLKG